MDKGEEIKKYVTATSDELIDNYKDLIKKTFAVTDKDLLQDKIDSQDEESEEKFLNAIKKRRVALDEVDLMLEKIDRLQKRLATEEDGGILPKNPVKKHSKN